MPKKTHVYKVTYGSKLHLVNAVTRAQARNHIAKDHIHVQLAEVMEVAKLVSGEHPVQIEQAGDEDPTQ